MTRPVTFVHLTDLHLGEPDDPHLHSDTTATLRAALAEIARIDPAPEFVVLSGDLTNAGDAASFVRLKAELRGLSMPLVPALGNHDTRAGFYQGWLGEMGGEAPYDHDCVLAGVHVVTLDSTIPGAIHGDLDAAQFDWLDGALAHHADLPKLVVVHHPPSLDEEDATEPWRSLPAATSRRLAASLASHHVLGVLSGHIHHDRFSLWRGVPVIVGAGLHAATDILDRENLRMVRGAGFGLGVIRPSGLTMAVIPLPSDRAELKRYPMAALRARVAAAR